MESAAEVGIPQPRVLQVHSTRFGSFAVPEHHIIRFPDGLIGFSEYHRFVIMEHATSSPLRWMLCLDEPELAFAIADPRDFFRDYDIHGYVNGHEAAGGIPPEDQAVLAIVTIPRDRPSAMSANLMAPIVVNVRSRVGRQIILDEGLFSTRHPLLPQPATG